MPSPADSSTDLANCEVISRRVFAATPEQLWRAFADPVRLAQWWGPNGFTNTFREFDLRPGGAWKFTMHAPNGATFDNEKTFLAVTPPLRVVFRHHGPMHAFTMGLTFTAQTGGTEVTWRMTFDSAAECAKMKNLIVAANEENFDRLAAHLAKS